MKKARQNKKFIKRVVSMATALTLLSINLPMQEISDTVKLIDFSRFTITAKAEANYDTSKFETIEGGSYTNLVSGMSMDADIFAEYSRCYKNDSEFASRHSGDTITLAPSGYWKIESGGDNQYEPLGTAANPFAGTIRVNAIDSSSMQLLMDVPFFDIVYDTVSIYKGDTSEAFSLEFIKTANNNNPLMANDVRHSGAGGVTWKAILSGSTITDSIDGVQIKYGNFYTYGGVIGKMNEGAVLTLDYTDDSTATQCYVKRTTAQGVLCGEMLSGSSLTANYTNANRTISVGDGANTCSGGLVGYMTGATFTLNSASSLNIAVNSGDKYAGLIVGSASSNSTIQLADSLSFSGSVTSSSERAGGIVGSLQESDISVGSTGDGSVTLSGVIISGTNKVGGVIGYFAPSSNNSNALTNISYALTGCNIGGTKPGGIIGEYVSVGGESIDVSNFTFTNTSMSSGSAGGVIGRYIANGDTMLTGSYIPPKSAVDFGGVIGEYNNIVLTRTLSLSNLTVSNITQTAGNQKLGGVVLTVTGSSYIDVNGVTVGVIGSNVSNAFGGIVFTLGDNAANGSFLDITGDFTLTTSNPYKGGAFAYSFKNGVMRLAGTTDIGGAQTANGYGQLIYDNDTTLVYSTGTGSDATWTFKRHNDTTASDLGQWGEVVRFSNMETAIVTVDSTAHTVTLLAASTSVTNTMTFAKLALNMQLNDGVDHGALLFAGKTTSPKSSLLTSDDISVAGKISLSGTGLLGLTRDGGNGKYLKATDNAFVGSPDFFSGTITGTSSSAEIELAVGEAYGCNASGTALDSDANGGRIYLSNTYGHDAQGLIAFGNNATISTLNISGTMRVSRKSGSDYLYLSPTFGVITNGATLTNVNVSTTATIDKVDDSRFYIGGAAGVFDGKDTGEKTLSVSGGSIAPTFNLNGSVACTVDNSGVDKTCTYAGGVLGLLKGTEDTNYKVTLSSTDISPIIALGDDVSNTNESYIGGVIGYVKKNSTNEREITFSTVTITNASVEQKAKHSGGLLGSYWDRTKVTINGLTINGSSVNNTANTASELSGLVYRATGNWAINTLSISNTDFSAESAAHTCFGLIVNRAYEGDDGLYLNLKNAGYTLSSVTLPSSTAKSYYVDEIAANTASSAADVVSGGNGVGIININMNTDDGSLSNITDVTVGETTAAGTGSYQNKALNNNKLISNQHSRYYYNLDVIKAKVEPSDGETFLMWSIYNYYAAANIQGYGVISSPSLTGLTNVDLRGLSYYPIDISSVTLPGATFTFGYDAIKILETSKGSDSWARYPDSTGNMETEDETRRNQHYLMQNSLFGNVTGTLNTSARITFAGVFGGLDDAGVLVGGTQTGIIDLKNGVTLSGIKPYSASSPMLVNYINGTSADISPEFYLTGLRQENYPASGTVAVASALINNAEGTNMKIIFSDIKLDARNGSTLDLNSAYGTSRSIFGDATLFKNLKSNATDTIEYNFTWDEDWGKDEETAALRRNVTYGQEITNSAYYKDEDDIAKSGERRYSGSKRIFTNPTVDTDTEYDFTSGFLPYVKNKNKDTTYNISEVKVNFVSSGLVEGCGTYNDPYIITSSKLLTKVANYINSRNSMLDTIRLPNALNSTWHEASIGDSIYKKGTTDTTVYVQSDSNDTLAISGWNQSTAREYLAGAYYVIPSDMTLTSDFPGIGKGGSTEDGKTVFHGVIVGQKKTDNKYPTITNITKNPFIYISNGSVIKNLNFTIDNSTNEQSEITIEQKNKGSGADYTFSYKDITSSDKTAKYYGGIFGEIMGGDNIIDGVTITYTANRPIKLTGDNKQLIAVGGFTGAVVNGGLIFRGTNSVTGFTVYDNDLATNALAADHYATIYANPYVGRVINGYAVNEGSSTLNNTTKHYTIDSIIQPTAEADKLDVSGSSISIPNAQALFVLSLITQSTAGTAVSASGNYGVSQSYGVNNSVFCGSNRLGTYEDVGKKHNVDGASVIYTTKSDVSDYNNKAINDVANANDTLRGTAVPYIIWAYTKEVSGNYPARTITYDNSKFWDITLSASGSFDLSVYPSFRGIGCMGNKATIYNMKIGTFDGSGKTIKLSMLESRYGRDAENYFHQENKSTSQAYSGDELSAPYGHDGNLYKLMGFGLFDFVSVKNDPVHQYQFQNLILQGKITEKVYNSSGTDITGKNDQSQLYCIGGVVGKRIANYHQDGNKKYHNYDAGNVSDMNFSNITFDGLEISGAYACGGLIGIDALKVSTSMHIDGCNSTSKGVEITGGYYGGSNDLRHGIGSFIGMTFLCRPIIDGGTNTSDITVFKVTTHYNDDYKRCNVGGLIGYTGTGAEIKNVRLIAANADSVIGSSKVYNTAGFIGFAQTSEQKDNNYLSNSVWLENCILENISVKAKASAAGFCGRSNLENWGPRYIYISGCSIIGTGTNKPEIKAYATSNSGDDYMAGGFISGNFSASDKYLSLIENSCISGYTIQGYNVGGIVGRKSQQPMNFKNVYVKDCDIVVNASGNVGGFIGYSAQNLSGYNMKIENVNFKKANGTDNTAGAGAFVGNSSSKINKFVAVAKYHTDITKIPSADIKSGSNVNNIVVYSDYTGQSLTNTKNTENVSNFGKDDIGKNITDQNKAPYLTLNPSSSMGTSEYISGDGAFQLYDALSGYSSYTSGKSAAARIYADWAAGSAFSNVTLSAPYSGAGTPDIGAFFRRTADSGDFKVSTWNIEMGTRPGVEDFTLLVVNDANDPKNTTNFIDNYIRLMTGTTSHYMADVSGKYRIVIKACRYNSETHKFELQNPSVTPPGLTKAGANSLNTTDAKTYTNGYYQMSLANADSKYDDQFTLIDVQYYDPTDKASDNNKRIAYHLYVPVLTKKTVNIEFSAASISGSEYKAQNYINKITSEIAGGKNANNPTTILDSMDVWTTTYIRFTYPISQVNELLKLGSDLQWNHDKKISIYWGMENNIPDNTKMVLIDPNNDVDRVYYSTAGSFQVVDRTRIVDFSAFTTRSSGAGSHFNEATLYTLLNGKVTPQANTNNKGAYNEVSSTTSGALHFKVNGDDKYYQYVNDGTGALDLVVTEPIYEDYYLSLLVPKTSGQADVVQIKPAGMANTVKADGTAAAGNVIRATVTSKLNAALVIGDFYQHNVDTFTMESALNSQIITDANKVLTATSVATISLIDNEEHTQAQYFANLLSDQSIYHSFNIQMIQNNTATSSTDIIQGIEKNNISATYTINNGTPRAISSDSIIREGSYIQCTTGDIKPYLINSANNYSVKITGVAIMDFVGYSDEFPSNPNEYEYIGVRGAVRSNISYLESELPYSKMNAPHEPVSPYFYTKEDNSALFSFDAIDELDDEKIGANTKNNSKLGINDHFVYSNTICGKSVYNASDVKDYANATSIVYTLELFRKTTKNGSTDYVQVNFPEYASASSIQLIDSEIPAGTGSLTKSEKSKSVDDNDLTYYEYSRAIDHDGVDKDAIFYTDFACDVLKGTSFTKKEYANYKIQLTVHLEGAANNERTSYIIYTNAKIDPTMIDEIVS